MLTANSTDTLLLRAVSAQAITFQIYKHRKETPILIQYPRFGLNNIREKYLREEKIFAHRFLFFNSDIELTISNEEAGTLRLSTLGNFCLQITHHPSCSNSSSLIFHFAKQIKGILTTYAMIFFIPLKWPYTIP